MKEYLKKWLRPVLFTMGGILAGYLYYKFAGCASGTCAITSNPWTSMLYMGLLGWLVSGVFGRGGGGCCR